MISDYAKAHKQDLIKNYKIYSNSSNPFFLVRANMIKRLANQEGLDIQKEVKENSRI